MYRMRGGRPSRANYRADWMASFEFIITNEKPETLGKINWDSAAYLFNLGKTPLEAATQYLATMKGDG